jgi:hypothetical protein
MLECADADALWLPSDCSTCSGIPKNGIGPAL